MLETTSYDDTWTPPTLSWEDQIRLIEEYGQAPMLYKEQLVFFQKTPYIDSIYVRYSDTDRSAPEMVIRFCFKEGYAWPQKTEKQFQELVMEESTVFLNTSDMDEIYHYYSEKNNDWHLRRYYNESAKLLDHIYHCMRRNTVKEMLYKAGLDELAVESVWLNEVNLLATKPSELYGGISLRTLRAFNNCGYGARMVTKYYNWSYILQLQQLFPSVFETKLNDAQCRYLNRLMRGELTAGECGRLFNARKTSLIKVWNLNQYELFIREEEENQSSEEFRMKEVEEAAALLSPIDPIYDHYIRKIKASKNESLSTLFDLRYYLLENRAEYDYKIRLANRKRDASWQERNQGYVVRYPQTINDFFRESIYMCNCLVTYLDAMIENDTTILFLRETDNFNIPFITMEVYEGELIQAYHRYNRDCKPEEAEWIRTYCERHGIGTSKFSFGEQDDLLF